jgi:hypothetical protein
LESVFSQTTQRAEANQWVFNPAIHGNEWYDLGDKDFRSAVDAFHDLWARFRCSKCDSILYVVLDGHKESALKCDCGSVNWNLTKARM